MTSVGQRLLWVLLGGFALAFVILVARHDEGYVGTLSTGDFAWLVYWAVLLVFVGGAVLVMFRQRFAQALTAALLWVALALILLVGYTYRYELHGVADRVAAELIPGHVISHGRTVEVARTGDGDFDISAHINGSKVPMVLDTGASSVVLTHDDA